MNKLIFTTLRGRRAAVLASEKRVLQIDFEGEEAAEQIGTIYIGKVRNVVKNLNAAFVEYKPGINGYYSLNDNRVHTFADGTRSERPLKSGDEVVVQISRAAVKTKDAVLSGELTLTGRYVAVLARDAKERSLGISSKIKDKKWREDFKAKWEHAFENGSSDSYNNINVINCCNFGIIVRTNAYNAEFSDVLTEALTLSARLEKICKDAAFRTPHSVLYRPDSFAVSMVRDLRVGQTTEIVTDDPEIFEELKVSGLCNLKERENDSVNGLSLRFYNDTYPLSSLYHLESSLDRALGKTVWLKSGGYLVIEPTEAMTVIDVNTGKNVDKKSPEETYFMTNLEAAAEIAAQLRLRNLSGIVIVDFIDMAEEHHNTELLNSFRQYLAQDPVKTTLVDMTALGLIEVTRKKVKRPLHELMLSKKGFSGNHSQ